MNRGTFAERLLKRGVVTADHLDPAIELQRQEGGRLGRHLLLNGSVDEQLLYQELASEWGLLLVDLVANPPDPELIEAAELTSSQWQRWIPWRRDESGYVVACCVQPDAALTAEVQAHLRVDAVRFRIATESQLIAAVQRILPDQLLFDAAEKFATEHAAYSAKFGLVTWQWLVPVLLFVALAIGELLDWRDVLVILLAVANIAFLSNVGFKAFASVLRPAILSRDRKLLAAERRELAASGIEGVEQAFRAGDLPVYTILVPVYDEANVIGKIIENLAHLSYPRAKLDVLVLLEESDTATIAAAQAADPPPYVRLLIVPEGQPRTKPRACNYGLLFARGEYVVIYDAEDRPDPDQLLKVMMAFRHDREVRSNRGGDPLACVQASLNYYNADYNVLTRMFAIEYAHWFDSMLPGMDAADTPIPLGGTSNHFLRSALVEVGGWDPYNVTEDADLGLRLAASGYRVDVVRSTTWEEATSHVAPWIRQRTRWIKGYILTAAVNLRRPGQWLRKNGVRGGVTMLGLILGTPLAFLLYPMALGFTLTTWLLGPIVPIWLPDWLLILGDINMIGMNLLMVISSGHAAWRRYNWRIAIFAVFLPVYWLLHSIAAWRAAFQVVMAPHLWEKTPHGITEEYDDSVVDNIGLPHSAAT